MLRYTIRETRVSLKLGQRRSYEATNQHTTLAKTPEKTTLTTAPILGHTPVLPWYGTRCQTPFFYSLPPKLLFTRMRTNPNFGILGLNRTRMHAKCVQNTPDAGGDGHKLERALDADVHTGNRLGFRELPDVEFVDGEDAWCVV
jgi:hypothetical protein